MPQRILLSGPAGASKSALAREIINGSEELTIAADFQSVVAALLLLQRGPDGKYPARDERILPTAEYVRQAIISASISRELGLVVTNSDGNPERRRFLLDRMGEGAEERIIDPGEDVVKARLSDPVTGVLAPECTKALRRWYAIKPRLIAKRLREGGS